MNSKYNQSDVYTYLNHANPRTLLWGIKKALGLQNDLMRKASIVAIKFSNYVNDLQ